MKNSIIYSIFAIFGLELVYMKSWFLLVLQFVGIPILLFRHLKTMASSPADAKSLWVQNLQNKAEWYIRAIFLIYFIKLIYKFSIYRLIFSENSGWEMAEDAKPLASFALATDILVLYIFMRRRSK